MASAHFLLRFYGEKLAVLTQIEIDAHTFFSLVSQMDATALSVTLADFLGSQLEA